MLPYEVQALLYLADSAAIGYPALEFDEKDPQNITLNTSGREITHLRRLASSMHTPI